jgi:diguanylate cyclase (GGDEF)-like protein/PAS domain S-box-containing protein
MKRFLQTVAVAAVYFIAAKLALRLAFEHPSAAPVWPPAGIALTCLLIWGYRLWPGIFLAAFWANLTTAGNVWTSLGIATGNTLEAVIATTLLNRFARGLKAMERPGDILRFALVAGIFSPLFSATVGVSSLYAGGYVLSSQFIQTWLTWWLGDLTGALTVTPFLLLWRTPIRKPWPWSQLPELAILGAAFLGIAWAILHYPVYFLCVPVVVWAAFRFGEREAATASLLFSAFAVWGTLHGYSAYVTQSSTLTLLLLQTFAAVLTLTGLAFASLVTRQQRIETKERRGVELALRASEKRYHQLLQTNILGIMIVDWDGRVIEANDAFLRMLGYTRNDFEQGLVGGRTMTSKEHYMIDDWARVKLRESGQCPPMEKEFIRKDGSRMAVLVGVVLQEEPDQQLVCMVIDVTEQRRAMDALRFAHHEMEARVTLRTKELADANSELLREVELRKRAENALRNLAITDVLTELHNRRGFTTLAGQLLKQAKRGSQKFILFLGDLDGLKYINDTHGHLEGDQAIQAMADILKDTFRESDVIARFGGDEFAIAVIDDGPETGDQPYLERLHQRIERYNQSSEKAYPLSLSVGVCSAEAADTRALEQLIECADKELYEEKKRKTLNIRSA